MIDEAGALQKILPKTKQKKTISSKEIEEVISKIAKIPSKNINQDDRSMLRNLERDLKAIIFGQDEAINKLSTAIKMSRSGLFADNKPIGSFMFSGPLIFVLTKADKVKKNEQNKAIYFLENETGSKNIFVVSSLKRTGIDKLRGKLLSFK